MASHSRDVQIESNPPPLILLKTKKLNLSSITSNYFGFKNGPTPTSFLFIFVIYKLHLKEKTLDFGEIQTDVLMLYIFSLLSIEPSILHFFVDSVDHRAKEAVIKLTWIRSKYTFSTFQLKTYLEAIQRFRNPFK